jgi:hypothetical protein
MNNRPPDFEIQITNSGQPHYTEPFPGPDKLAVMLLVENNSTGAGTITATPQHSNDGGRNWIDKSNLSLSPNNSLTANTVTPHFGADDGTTPNMELMRLKLQTSAASPNVKVFISSRTY